MGLDLPTLNRRRRGGSASAPAFSPSTLYSSGSQGIWLDPSDLSTMFSDRAGTTPVTTPGTVVGLRLDKSKGLVLGAELVTGGSDVSKWVARGSNTVTSIAGGVEIAFVGGSLSDFGAYSYLSADGIGSQNLSTAKTYIVSLDAQCIGGTASVAITNFSEGYTSALVGGTATRISFRFRPLVSNPYMQCSSLSTGESIKLTNISVRELPGNHATAPSDAARPIYGVEPKGGRRNLLTWSEDFRNTATAGVTRPWNHGGISAVTDNFSVAPDGTITADRFTTGGGTNGVKLINQMPAVSATTYTFSTYVKDNGGAARSIEIMFSSAGFATSSGAIYNFDTNTITDIPSSAPFTLVSNSRAAIGSSGWYRISTTVTVASAQSVYVVLGASYTAAQAGDYLIWGAQLELGSTATAYQRVTTAYDITESGVATCHYVQYDGSDDGMITNSIDFTATDKMSVFAGVRKLSDAASFATVIEASANAGSNVGAFILRAPQTGATYAYFSRGSASLAAAISPSSFAAPITNVLTGLGDISGDTATLRVNGAQASQATTDQGTGNFGNYKLNIGRRGNDQVTPDLPFYGRDYGIVVVGKATTADEITSTEKYMAGKTGVTL